MVLTFAGDAMPGSWNAETYRARERQWRAEAESQPPGKDRDACMALAEGYAHLAAIIDELNGGCPGGKTMD
jgi:hypothetical protein